MIRRLLIALFLLLASALAAVWLENNDGYLVLVVGAWRVEMSLVVFVGAMVAVVLLGWALGAFLLRVLLLPRRTRRWFAGRRQRRARNQLTNAIVKGAQGDYRNADRLLRQSAQQPGNELPGYLLAAVVAQRQGDTARRDDYLAKADRSAPDVGPAVSLIQAQLQAEAGQWEQALATLTSLSEGTPDHPRVLTLLRDTYLALERWDDLAELLPRLRKLPDSDDEQMRLLERRVAVARLQLRARHPAALAHVWDGLPKAQRQDHGVLLTYARAMIDGGESDRVEPLLRSALNKRWDDQLVECYGALESGKPEQALNHCERWLKNRQENGRLLYAAGRQALANSLWGRAQSYLEAAAPRLRRADVYRLLAAVYEEQGQPEQARQAADQALELAVPVALPNSARPRSLTHDQAAKPA